MSRTSGRYPAPSLAPLLLALVALLPGLARANGFNRIDDVAIPLLIIALAIVYAGLALVPALLVWVIFRLATKKGGGFALAYLGAWLGGELGLGLCVLLWKLIPPEGYDDRHYTLYPWVILGLSLLAGALGCHLARLTRPPRG